MGLDIAESIGAPGRCCPESPTPLGAAHGLIPRGTGNPSLGRGPSRDSTGGARADRPLSQPRDTGLFHCRRPPTLCRGLPASLLARGGGGWRRGRGGRRAAALDGCCERCGSGLPGCTAERGKASPSVPAAGQRGEGPLSLGSQGCTSLHPWLSPGAQTAWRDLFLLCYGETEALGAGDREGRSHERPVTVPALSLHPRAGGGCGDSTAGTGAGLSPALCRRFSALHHAALGGSLDLISLLLEAQATVDIKDSNGKE